MKQAAGRAP